MTRKTLPQAIDLVAAAQRSTYVDFYARETLRKAEGDEALAILASAWTRKDVRKAAKRALLAEPLARLANASTLPLLIELVCDGQKGVRLPAIGALERLYAKHSDAIDAALQALQEQGSPSVRKHAQAARNALPSSAAEAQNEPEHRRAWLAALQTADTQRVEAFKKELLHARYYQGGAPHQLLERISEEQGPVAALVTLFAAIDSSIEYPSEDNFYRWRKGLEALAGADAVAHLLPWAVVGMVEAYATRVSKYTWDVWHTERLLMTLETLPEEAIVPPLLYVLQHSTVIHAHLYLDWLQKRLARPWNEAFQEVLLRHIESTSVPVREKAAELLSSCPPTLLPRLWPMLQARTKLTRLAAAMALAAIPSRDSLPHLRARLEKEKTRDVTEALTRAIAACDPIDDSAEESGADLDARLARQAPKRLPRILDRGKPLPSLCWARSGEALSEGAQAWVLGMLSQEGPKHHEEALDAVRERLENASCHTLFEAIQRCWSVRDKKDRRWVYFAHATLGSEAHIHTLGRRLDWDSIRGQHTYAFYGLEILKRHNSPAAWHWLRHCATRARNPDMIARARPYLMTARRNTHEARADIGAPRAGFDPRGEQPLSLAGRNITARLEPEGKLTLLEGSRVLKRAPSGMSSEDKETLDALRKDARYRYRDLRLRLEQAMATGRSWSPEDWRRLFLDHPMGQLLGKGLLFRLGSGAWGLLSDEGELLDAEGEPLELAGPITLPHRLRLTEAERDAASSLLGELELSPQIEQLEREVFERPLEGLAREDDIVVRTLNALPLQDPEALERRLAARGFHPHPRGDYWTIANFYLELGSWSIRLGCPRQHNTPPGTQVAPRQLVFRRSATKHAYGDALPFHEVDPCIFSEALRLVSGLV